MMKRQADPPEVRARGAPVEGSSALIVSLHAAAGAACGLALKSRRAAAGAALASHFLIDLVNHEEPVDRQRRLRGGVILLDGLLAAAGLAALSRNGGPVSFGTLAGAVAALPDLEHVVVGGTPRGPVHRWFPHSCLPNKRITLAGQFALAVLAWLALLCLRRRVRQPASAGRVGGCGST